ncbi:MAG TPA: hypothetical protein VEW03_05595 [Longimicrobiaceae bacterium]|nr:hypothetical protein [Longimicrobiaceae bacterium]
MNASPAFPLLLVLAAATACAAPPDATTLHLEARRISREAARGDVVAAVESGRHSIRVRRTIRLPDPCRTLSGDVRETGAKLTLQVVAEPDGRRCRRAEAYLAYVARVDDLAPGRYDLRVVHAYPGERDSTASEGPVVVLEQAVEVPE